MPRRDIKLCAICRCDPAMGGVFRDPLCRSCAQAFHDAGLDSASTDEVIVWVADRVMAYQAALAERITDGPRCSCTHEAGDSECERHPADPETGELIDAGL